MFWFMEYLELQFFLQKFHFLLFNLKVQDSIFLPMSLFFYDNVLVFKQNSARKLNYKQISKLLSIKDMGTKIILVEALEDLANKNFIKVVSRGSYRYIHKKTTIIGIVAVLALLFAI